MKKWNDKTKKIALAAALIVVGIGAFCGIRLTLIKDKPVEVAAETPKADESDVNVVVDTEYEEDTTVQETEELTISTEPIDSTKTADTDDTTQSIQSDPVKTEENKPSEAPAEAATKAEQNGSSEKPENKKIPADTPDTTGDSGTDGTGTSSSPQNGEVKDGKIYIEGFGWVDYEGGGTSGIQGDDIYENGNTIGIMD